MQITGLLKELPFFQTNLSIDKHRGCSAVDSKQTKFELESSETKISLQLLLTSKPITKTKSQNNKVSAKQMWTITSVFGFYYHNLVPSKSLSNSTALAQTSRFRSARILLFIQKRFPRVYLNVSSSPAVPYRTWSYHLHDTINMSLGGHFRQTRYR